MAVLFFHNCHKNRGFSKIMSNDPNIKRRKNSDTSKQEYCEMGEMERFYFITRQNRHFL